MSPRRWPRLLRALVHAQARIPLYRDLWGRAGIDVRRFTDPDDFRTLPLLTRRDLIAAGTEGRIDPRFPRDRLRTFATSGSSGEPLQLLFDRQTLRRRQWRFAGALWMCGYRPGQRVMLVSSRSSQSVKQVSGIASLMRWHYVDLYAGEAELLTAFQRIRPHVLYAPQNALLTLMAAAGTEHATHRPDILVSTSERLTGIARRQLREHFGVDVTDFYGLTELGLLAWRRAAASGYDWAGGDVHLEFLPAADAAGGSLLVASDLQGGSMPLYRYVTGDLVRTDGRQVVEFGGKQLDSLLMPDGSRVAPYRVDGVLTQIEGLVRYRIVQQTDLSIEASIEACPPEAARSAQKALTDLVGNRVPVRLVSTDFASEPLAHKARPIVSRARSTA